MSAKEKKSAVLGRAIGFEAVDKEKYRLLLLDLINGEVKQRVEIDRGAPLSMHQAFFRFNSLVNKQIRFFLPSLWRFNPDIVGVEAAKAAIEDWEKTQKLKQRMPGVANGS